ncbi:putative flippase GtrA [Kineothrix alysoides]|uniref:Putative flippase GtrA n=1 Tax=Kineothrix alysoides TaxID=1469948 RepID=A0A4R1R208_9FIRM|nr:GtrA family protein [Kineothrix alysoides]TCL59348.1 putative flippase GtrA [Kineothrix alysoides]
MLKRLISIIGTIINKTFYIIFKIFGIELSNEKYKEILQFIKFGLVGLSNTFIYYIAYLISIHLGAHYFTGNAIGFIVSVLNSFYWNKKYVFEASGGIRKSIIMLLKTFVAYGVTGLLISNILLFIWIDKFYIAETIAPLINLLVTIPLNYFINKFWAFK